MHIPQIPQGSKPSTFECIASRFSKALLSTVTVSSGQVSCSSTASTPNFSGLLCGFFGLSQVSGFFKHIFDLGGDNRSNLGTPFDSGVTMEMSLFLPFWKRETDSIQLLLYLDFHVLSSIS